MTGSTEPAAALRAVSKRYGAVSALERVDLQIGRGETVALLGPNGAGKSTSIGLLLGLERPDVEARHAFWERMRAFAAQGRTVLFATHYLEEADAVADRVLVLRRGRVVVDGPVSAIKARGRRRFVRCTLPGAEETALRALAGVSEVQRHGDTVRLTTTDADATVRALFAGGLDVRDLEVTGGGLEQAFMELTGGRPAGA